MLSFVEWLVVIALLIHSYGLLVYFLNTLKGRTKPNKVTWFLWALVSFIAFYNALLADADIWPTSRVILAFAGSAAVFAVSFYNPLSYWKISKFDLICGFCSLVALYFWLILDQYVFSVVFAAIGNFMACLPTVLKSWRYPNTETRVTYLLSLLSILLIFPSVPEWNLQNTAMQCSILFNSLLLFIAAYRDLLKISMQTSNK